MHQWGGSRWAAAVFVLFAYSTDEDKRQQCVALNSLIAASLGFEGKVKGIRRTDVPLKCGNFQVLGDFFCFILRDLAMTLTQPCCTAHMSLDLFFIVAEPTVWFQTGKNLGLLCSCSLTKKAPRKELLQ